MTHPAVRLASGLALALGLVLPFVVPTIAGIATWKVVLGVLGAALFIAGSRGSDSSGLEGRERQEGRDENS